jgi:acetylornithine/succinyldiaminopimelate/putrescine aminotransferase
MILDEVWCGTGISGKMFCIDWDNVNPDFIFMGKTFASGYMPISAVVTRSEFEGVIKRGSGRIENSTTFQGHSAATAAALECVRIIKEDGFLDDVNRKGARIRSTLEQSLKDHEFFKNVRGRGMRNSLEYTCQNMNEFGQELSRRMLERHKVLINGKWHRLTFSNAMTVTDQQIDFVLSALVDEFNSLSSEWTADKAAQVKLKNYF